MLKGGDQAGREILAEEQLHCLDRGLWADLADPAEDKGP